MKVAIIVCLFAVLALTQAASLLERFNGIVGHKQDKPGSCKMYCNHSAWCTGSVNDVKVGVMLLVDEFEKNEGSTMIIGKFFAGGQIMEKEFPVDKIEDFCEKVDGEDWCFELDVKQMKKCCTPRLKGTVSLTKPAKVSLGSFSLPMANAQIDDVTNDDTDEMTFEEIDGNRFQ